MLGVDKNKCVGCGICESKCPVGAISVDVEAGFAVVDKEKCTECNFCVKNCPQNAIIDIKGELVLAIGTDDEKTIKPDDHFGMSKYFQIWKLSSGDGNLTLVETRENAKYKEDETKIHGDPGKAKATASVLGGVDVLIGKMMGPNIERLKQKFVPVVIREPDIEKARELIRENVSAIAEEKAKEVNERHGLILG